MRNKYISPQFNIVASLPETYCAGSLLNTSETGFDNDVTIYDDELDEE